MDLKTWATQITTGIGASGLLATLSGAMTGAVTWQHAIPLLVGSIASILFPENKALAPAAQQTTADLETVIPIVVQVIKAVTAPAPVATTTQGTTP